MAIEIVSGREALIHLTERISVELGHAALLLPGQGDEQTIAHSAMPDHYSTKDVAGNRKPAGLVAFSLDPAGVDAATLLAIAFCNDIRGVGNDLRLHPNRPPTIDLMANHPEAFTDKEGRVLIVNSEGFVDDYEPDPEGLRGPAVRFRRLAPGDVPILGIGVVTATDLSKPIRKISGDVSMVHYPLPDPRIHGIDA